MGASHCLCVCVCVCVWLMNMCTELMWCINILIHCLYMTICFSVCLLYIFTSVHMISLVMTSSAGVLKCVFVPAAQCQCPPWKCMIRGGAVALALIGPSTPGCDRERIALPKSRPPVICIQIGQLGSPQPRQAHVATRWEKLLAENTTPGTCFHVFRGGNVCPCTLLSLEWYGLCNWYVISLFLQPVFFFFFLTVFCCASFNHR